jgi:ferritin-like metal-binding protein YciE
VIQELFVHNLSEIYDAEHQFVEGQQEMASKPATRILGAPSRNI